MFRRPFVGAPLAATWHQVRCFRQLSRATVSSCCSSSSPAIALRRATVVLVAGSGGSSATFSLFASRRYHSSENKNSSNNSKKEEEGGKEKGEAKKEEAAAAPPAEDGSASTDNNNNTSTAIQPRHKGFIEPSDDIVMETARKALAREGRDEIPESIVWSWETSAPPILARGKQNIYDYTDDIPEHVKPFWHHEYYQQREYFRLQREKRPLKERLRLWGSVTLVLGVAWLALIFFRVWVEQPREIRQMREEILQQTYGRVLELAAGHGQNIGAYPYAVHEVVLTDSNPQQLQTLRYRVPRTAYPKYDIQRVRSESLENFKDEEFDCVVDMFGLCHLHDPVMALRQMQRVVKPSGLILLLEHGASPYPPVNWFLNYFEKQHQVNTHGCKWNSPIREYLQESKLEIKELRNKHYGTTYYVVAYPEVLESYKVREPGSSGTTNANTSSKKGTEQQQQQQKQKGGGWFGFLKRQKKEE